MMNGSMLLILLAGVYLVVATEGETSTEKHSVEPCIGDDRGDQRCDHDWTHVVCARLVNATGGGCEELKWGDEDFWSLTEQERWNWKYLICNTTLRDSDTPKPFPGDSWCICMWATARLIGKVGCDNVHIHCESTDVNHMIKQYYDGNAQGGVDNLEPARCCMLKKCKDRIKGNDETGKPWLERLQTECNANAGNENAGNENAGNENAANENAADENAANENDEINDYVYHVYN